MVGWIVSSKSSPGQATGYEPEKLDSAIRRHLAVAETSVRHAEALGQRVEEALKNLEGHKLAGAADLDTALEEASLLTVLFDRQSKAVLNLVKATDELSRLRSFVAGGADSRPDLASLSDSELAAKVLEAAQQVQGAA